MVNDSDRVIEALSELGDGTYPDAWIPKNPGDRIAGIITRIGSMSNDYGSYPIIEIQDPSGHTKSIHALHSVLRNELVAQRPQKGDALAVVYLGESEEGADGREPYKRYRAIVKSQHATGFDWSSFDDA